MDSSIILYALSTIGVFAIIWFFVKRSQRNSFYNAIKTISSEHKKGIVVPDGLDGFIELGYLLLTPHGLLVVEYRDVKGTVFPGENLEQWPVMYEGQRNSISNPYQALRHRLTAVKALVSDVPISGVLVFPDDIEFGNTPPDDVIRVSELYRRFGNKDIVNQEQLVSAFKQSFNDLNAHQMYLGTH